MVLNKLQAGLVIALTVPTAFGASQAVPATLAVLAAKAGVDGPFFAWCNGEFRPGQRDAFAVAVPAAQAAGRYVIIESDGKTFHLSSFKGRADLSCYTRAEAKRLSATIAASETVHGGVNPPWSTTVICGFVEDTNAVCWQYSPPKGQFVKVGEWVT